MRCFVFLFLTVSYSSFSSANLCSGLLKKTSTATNLRFAHTLDRYEDLKKHPMWGHEDQTLQNNIVHAFLNQSTEDSANTLYKIMIDLKESDKLALLIEAYEMLSLDQNEIDLQDYARVSEVLEKTFDVILDFGLDAGPRLRRFAFGSQVLIRNLDVLQAYISRVERQNNSLLNLFELVAQNADETIKTSRFVDPSTLEIKPFPEEITLLSYTIRHQYLELFGPLVRSPQITGQLHLDYSVLLLDEVERLPSDARSSYRVLANMTFSPEALVEYNKGKRGADGTTMWDRIPIGAY